MILPVPVAITLAAKFILLPLHTGELLVIVGVPGGTGSLITRGPIEFAVAHPFRITVILEYVPADKLIF